MDSHFTDSELLFDDPNHHVTVTSDPFVSLSNSSNCLGQSTAGNYSPFEKVVLGVVTALFCLLGFIGNLAVIYVICTNTVISRHQHNLYLLSLAVSDVLLVVLVVPFSLTNELMGEWPFGELYCRIYLSVDILLCTASIWNIFLIGLDRYVSVSYPTTYRKFRAVHRIRMYILGVWIFSALVSALPFVGKMNKINGENECFINDSTWFILLSTSLSFFIPALIVWPLYIKIYRVGRQLEMKRRARGSSYTTDDKPVSLSKQQCRQGDVVSTHNPTKSDIGSPTADKETCCKNPDNYPEKMHLLNISHENIKTQSANIWTNNSDLHNLDKSSFDRLTDVTRIQNSKRTSSVDKKPISVLHPMSTSPGYLKIRFSSASTEHHSYLEDCYDKLCCHKIVKKTAQAAGSTKIGVACASQPVIAALDNGNPDKSTSLVTTNIKNRKMHRPSVSSQASSHSRRERSQGAYSPRERRFVLIISIVMGCFMICWVPFFSTYFVYALCRPSCCINNKLFIIFFWLGYLNSAINPILYTVFNKDFRRAFRKLPGKFIPKQ